MSVLVRCRLRRGAALNSMLREPFIPRFINSERLWFLGVGEEAVAKTKKRMPFAISKGMRTKAYLR